LGLFREALRACPGCPAEVRMGIGACHFRLGDVSQAEKAYKRALELDPGCIEALLGLAVMAMAVGEDADSTRQGSQLLAQAFRQDPEKPHTLTLLAHFSLQQGLASSAERLASAALKRIGPDEPTLLAEATCLLGRAHHAQGALAEAARCYQRALALDPSQPVARLALSQMSVLRGENLTAVKALEKLLADKPAWMDALRVLAPLCPRSGGAAAAAGRTASHFKAAAERQPDNANLWEMLGDVLANADPAAALSSYNKAIHIHRKSAAAVENGTGSAAVPARLLNNAAVLQMRAGDYSKAQQLVAESLLSASTGGLNDLGPQAQVTLVYNGARIREAAGDLQGAEAEYKALLAQFPQYADCHLRLACIYKAQGNIAEAEAWAQKATEASGRSADSLALLAGLYLERRDNSAAKQCLNELTKSMGEGSTSMADIYANVALGNVHLSSVPGQLDKDEQIRKAEAQLSYAAKCFQRVLQADPGNVFAANGVGCVLAELGRFGEAKEVFLRVQEAAAGTDGFLRVPDAWINLASVYMGLGQFGAAEQTYQNAIRRFSDPRDPRVLLYLAKAQHDGGNTNMAARTLCRALHLAPSDPRLRFNLAYLMQQQAVKTVSKKWTPGDASKPKDLTAAAGQLTVCHRIFSALRESGNAVTGIHESKLDDHINYIATVHEDAVKLAKAAEIEAAAAAVRIEEQRLLLEAAVKKKELEEMRKKAETEAKAKAHEEIAREKAKKLEMLKQEWKQGAALAKAAEAGDSGAIGKGHQSGLAQKPDAVDALFDVDDEEDDFDYDPTKQDSDGEGGGHEAQGTGLLAAGLLSSDDEDDEHGGEDFDDAAHQEEQGVEKSTGGVEEKPLEAMDPPPTSSKTGGRLKKRGRDQDGAMADMDDFDLAEEAGKRARQTVTLEDSDEEEADRVEASKQAAADLFGSDSE